MKIRLVLPVLALLALAPLRGELVLPAIFSDHMVLQQQIAAPVWGTANPGTTVKVTFAGQTQTATAGADGRWQVKLAPQPVNAKGQDLTIATTGGSPPPETRKITDVLVGEVWLASGQSNMGFPLSAAHNAATEIPAANDPLLRCFTVTKKTAVEPQTVFAGKWELTTPDTAKNFTAVGYFFGKDLRQKLGCPVAIVNASWGGTPGQAWVSLDALRKPPAFTRFIEQWDAALAKHQQCVADPTLLTKYQADLKQWQTEVAPAYAETMKAYNAAKAAGQNPGPKPTPSRPEPPNPDPTGMPSPSARPGVPSVIFNAMIHPLIPYGLRGFLWYQGEANGSGGIEYRALLPRLITDWRSRWGEGDPAFLVVQLPGWDSDKVKAPVDQDWPYLREAQLMALSVPRVGVAVTVDIGDPNNVHPGDKVDVGHRLALAARGIAYGEKVVHSGPIYHDAKPQGSTIVIGFTEVGGGLKIGQAPWCAPGVQPYPTDKLIGFVITGADRHWVDADAVIKGNTVVVSSPQVPKPVAVRYAWANSPRANLYNREGLPASPFRTDDWTKNQPAGPTVKTE